MPFDLSITAVGGSNPGWSIHDPRWLEGTFPESLRPYIREISDGAYRDRFTLITREELRAWHRAAVPSAFDGLYAYPDWRAALEPKIERLEALLREPPSRSTPFFFMVRWAEWESGLG